MTKTSDFKLISSVLRYLSEYDNAAPTASAGAVKQVNQKKENKNIKLLNDLQKLLGTANKFKRVSNSRQLQKKFNKLISAWVADSKTGHIRRAPDKSRYLGLNAGYSYLLLYLVGQITMILTGVKRKKYIAPAKFIKLILFEMLYYFVLVNYYRSQAKYDPAITSTGGSGSGEQKQQTRSNVVFADEIGSALGEIKKSAKKFWYFHMLWQNRYGNYLKNMSKRTNLAFIHEHMKITTNPIIFQGMRGGESRCKLMLGNNGARAIALYPYLALPSQHWNMAEPEAHLINNLYNLKRIVIPPKHTKEIPFAITFPRSLSFSEYAAVLKLTPKSFKLLPELG